MGSAIAEKTPAGAQAAAADKTQRPDTAREGKKGDCLGPRKETATRWNVTQGGYLPPFQCIPAPIPRV